MNGEECHSDCLTPEERGKILSRFHSLLFWVGENIPEMEVLDGREVPLKEVVFRFITQQYPDEDTVAQAMELARALEAKARSLQGDLKVRSLERERAYGMMHEALGLLRAVDELRSLGKEDRELKARALMARVADEKRWLDLVRAVRK